MGAVVVVRRAVVIVLLLRLVCLTSALRLAGRCTIDGIERLMAATLVRPVTTVQLGLRQTTVRPEGVGIEDRHRQLACALSLLLTFGLTRGDITARRVITALQLIVRLAGAPATDGIERLMAAVQSPRGAAPGAAVQLGRAVRRRVARVGGHHVLDQTVSPLLSRRLTHGNIVAGVVTPLETVSLAGGAPATGAADRVQRLVTTAQSPRGAPSTAV